MVDAVRSRLGWVAAPLAVLATWEVTALIADDRLFPTPDVVIDTLVERLTDGDLLTHAQVTFERGFTGLAIAIAIGIALGVAMGRSRVLAAMLEPLMAATYPVPKIALYPLFILAFGFGAGAKIALVALECAYPIAYNTFAGIQGIRRQYFLVAMNVEAGRWERVKLAIRAATPSVLAGVRIAIPIMLVIITVTELLGESVGLGFLIQDAGSSFDAAGGLAVVLFLGICGFVFDRLIVAATRVLAFWQRGPST
jgi:ABC-type nitrate/sulfonate/bicarbonate transport system permease component